MMKRSRVIVLLLVLLFPTSNAQGIETVFNDALNAMCNRAAGVDVGPIELDLPTFADLGLDSRSICQYANIATRGTNALNNLKNGALNTTEAFINDLIGTLAGNLGARIGTEEANEVIEELDEELRTALSSGDLILGEYRQRTNEVIERLREENETALRERQAEAQQAVEDAKAEGAPPASSQDHRIANPANTAMQTMVDDAALNITEERVQSDILTEASTQLLEEQAENNAHESRIGDILYGTESEIPGVPGTPAITDEINRDARSATSVRQSLNVLTNAIAEQLRSDAIYSGAIVENLRASARQQVVTNHQLGILANNAIAEQEQELLQAEAELKNAFEEAHSEVSESLTSIKTSVEELKRTIDPGESDKVNFNFCGLFPSQC